MAAVGSAEVQAVLQEALKGQECEDDGDLGPAVECYYRASCQLSYILDLQVEKGSPLATMCQCLLQTYEQRMTALKAKLEAAKGPQWVQVDQLAPHGGLSTDLASSATAAPPDLAYQRNGPVPHQPRQRISLLQLQHQPALGHWHVAGAAAAAGAAGLQQVYDEEPASPSSCPAASLELLRTCQRAVSGSLDDVVGLEQVKDELEEAIFLPLQHPHIFKGIRQPPRTFLLHGPPGTGKTLLVEKVAAEAGFVLLSISPSMVLSKWAGDSEKAISGVFELARSFQPCIIFLDEVDSLGQSRDGSTDPGGRRLLTELLIQFTRATAEEGVYVFGATNRMQDCDPALLRRFSRRIRVPLPDTADRAAFFSSVLSRPELQSELSAADIAQLAQLTDGYSGSDLADVCRMAALAPVRDLMRHGGSRKRRRRGCSMLPLHEDRGECWTRCGAGDGGGTGASPQRPGSAASAGSQQQLWQEMGAGGATARSQQRQQQQQQQQQADGVKQEGGQLPGGAAGDVQLRSLVLADFQGALAVVKPAAQDAGMTD